MATPESKVKKQLDTMLKAEKVWYFSPQAGPYGVAGIPDRIAIVCGLFVGIEVKADAKGKMTALQERCKEQIVDAGGIHFLVYDKATIEEVRQWIIDARNRGQTGGGSGVGQPTGYPRCNTIFESSTGQACINSSQAGRDGSVEELGTRSTKPNLTLL